VVAAARTGVSQDVAPNQVIWGAPSQPMRDEMKTLACLRRLPKLMDDFQELRKKLTS